MRSLSHRVTIGLMALLIIVAGIVGWAVAQATRAASFSGIALREAFPQAPGAPPPVRPPAPKVAETVAPAAEAAPQVVVVHITGAVKKPGVYRLNPEARNEDALEAAGGSAANADTEAVNLAARVEDGSQLHIPTREEGLGSLTASSSVFSAGKKKGGSPSTRSEKSGKLHNPKQGTVNINTASAEELQRLPGIGPAMAERILEFRQENHGFQTIEDLMQVRGIGEKKFEKMKPLVRLR